MSINETAVHWFTAWTNGYHSVEVNFAPADVMATTSLFGVMGTGTSFAGIMEYRRRLSNGEDHVVSFGTDWLNWPPAKFDHMSSITFSLAEGETQEGWLVGRMDHWS